MITLELDEATETRLREEASRRGLTAEQYAVMVLDVLVKTRSEQEAPFFVMATDAEWEKEIQTWIDDQDASVPTLPDEASVEKVCMRTGIDPHLSDTNILLRLAQKASSHHSIARAAVSRLRRAGSVVYIVPQNIVEFWSVATRPISMNGLGYSTATADRLTRRLEKIFPLIPDSSAIHDEWRRLVVSSAVTGRQVHDARLVASMVTHGITHILTFNLADFRRYPGISVVDPATVAAGP